MARRNDEGYRSQQSCNNRLQLWSWEECDVSHLLEEAWRILVIEEVSSARSHVAPVPSILRFETLGGCIEPPENSCSKDEEARKL